MQTNILQMEPEGARRLAQNACRKILYRFRPMQVAPEQHHQRAEGLARVAFECAK